MRQRRAALADELQTAEAALTDARAALADGTLKASAVAASQISRDVLVGALGELDGRIEQLAALEAAQRASEQRAAAVKYLTAEAGIATASRERLVALIAEAREQLGPLFDAMREEVNTWAGAREAWVNGATDLAPGLRQRPFGDSPWAVPGETETAEQLMRELGARGDLEAVLTRVLWLTPETTRDSTEGLGLPRDELTLGLFSLFRGYFHARDGHNRLQL